MIDRDFAKKQIARLGCLPFAPITAEGMAELVTTLAAKAQSKQHATRVIDAILESPGEDRHGQRRWPDPERIRAIAWSLLDEKEKRRSCRDCGGGGWVSMTIGQYDFAKRCPCNPALEEEPKNRQEKAMTGRVPYRDLDD